MPRRRRWGLRIHTSRATSPVTFRWACASRGGGSFGQRIATMDVYAPAAAAPRRTRVRGHPPSGLSHQGRPATWLNAIRVCSLAAILCGGDGVQAASLTDVFRNNFLSGLQLGPIGPALAGTVASTY